MTGRDVIIKVGEILAQHGALTADYIIEQLDDVLDDRIAVEDWVRIAAAVAVSTVTSPTKVNLERTQSVVDRTAAESGPSRLVQAEPNDVYRPSGAGRCNPKIAVGRPIETATARRCLVLAYLY